MRINLNGEAKLLEKPISVKALLERTEMEKPYVAVSINMTCIPRSRYSEVFVEDGDEVEILVPYQGG